MRKSVKQDLFDACDALEHLVGLLPKMTQPERIDVIARLRGAAKTIETIDKMVKTEIKDQLKHQEGTLPGEIFKAMLTLIIVNRLDQQKLKVEYPTVYAKCLNKGTDERVTFEPRGL